MKQKIISKIEKFKYAKIQKKIDKGTYKSSFLRTNVVKKSYKPPIMEIVIKWIVLVALMIGVSGTSWQSRAKNKAVVNEAYNKIMARNFTFLPAALAFSLVMAFVPILLLIYIVIGSNPRLFEQVNEMLDSMFGQYASIFSKTSTDIAKLFDNSSSTLSLVFVILLSSWISAAGLSKFIFSCSLIYKHNKFGGFWMNRMRGVFMVVGIALYLSLIFIVFTGLSAMINKIGWLHDIHWLYVFVSKFTSFVMIVISLYVGNALLFKIAPRFKLTWRQIHPGAVIATLPSSIFLFLFTTITSYTLNYSLIGGSLSSFMTLSMSVLVFSYFIYIGVIANAAFYNIHVAKTTKRKLTVSKK